MRSRTRLLPSRRPVKGEIVVEQASGIRYVVENPGLKYLICKRESDGSPYLLRVQDVVLENQWRSLNQE